MPLDPDDPMLELNLNEVLDDCTFLEPHERAEVAEFVWVMNEHPCFGGACAK